MIDLEFKWRQCPTTNCPCPNHNLPTYAVGRPDTFRDDEAYYHLTRTNFYPEPSDEANLEHLISNLQKTKAAVHESMADLKALRAAYQDRMGAMALQLKFLEKERKRLDKAIHNRRCVLNPVRRLPPEILSKIFMYTVRFPVSSHRAPEGSTSSDPPHSKSMLWNIELVCRRWRQDVLADQSLWSFITIFISAENFARVNQKHAYFSRLAKHLSRAQSSTLSLCICRSSNADILPIDLPVFILSFAHRIQELHLDLPPAMIAKLSPLRHHFQLLTTLHIVDSIARVDEDTAVEGIAIFEQCSNLRRLHMSEVLFPDQQFAIPWQNLEKFYSESSLRPTELRRILDRAHNLEYCLMILEDPDYSAQIPIVCHNLVTLTILHVHPEKSLSLLELFSRLTLPSLRHLEIHLGKKTSILSDDAFSAVVNTIEQSRCPLGFFYFPRGELLPGDIIRLLRATPMLEAIQLGPLESLPALTNEVISELTIKPDTPIVSPRLRVLRVSGSLQFDGDLFVEMVKSRWQIVPFRHIRLVWAASDEEELHRGDLDMVVVSSGLEEYCDRGLSFEAESSFTGNSVS